jgi:hypothetical protein
MPLRQGSDSKGHFYQWGYHGKKYYWFSPSERCRARKKALRQGNAIFASGYSED